MKHTTYSAGLFGSTGEPVELPPHNSTPTSIAAALLSRAKAKSDRATILAKFIAQKDRSIGWTQAEMSIETGIGRPTLCARFNKLEQLGAIRPTHRTRASVGTRDCAVYELCERIGAE